MDKRDIIRSTTVIILTSLILCVDIFFTENTASFFTHVIHCIGEAIIILMFSRELRGDF